MEFLLSVFCYVLLSYDGLGFEQAYLVATNLLTCKFRDTLVNVSNKWLDLVSGPVAFYLETYSLTQDF